ncbi:hypothetical protein Nepgr_002291 [Nepenthes gracilis]|uniref:Uncharacterized protein n=1 Tax=Nepenthes gracilis TaxID=150966 RepID=A0AAD3RWR7_NEPGR|nr:hypothetical protein Nepgr_002291 [Nepenthes gracilis]
MQMKLAEKHSDVAETQMIVDGLISQIETFLKAGKNDDLPKNRGGGVLLALSFMGDLPTLMRLQVLMKMQMVTTAPFQLFRAAQDC